MLIHRLIRWRLVFFCCCCFRFIPYYLWKFAIKNRPYTSRLCNKCIDGFGMVCGHKKIRATGSGSFNVWRCESFITTRIYRYFKWTSQCKSQFKDGLGSKCKNPQWPTSHRLLLSVPHIPNDALVLAREIIRTWHSTSYVSFHLYYIYTVWRSILDTQGYFAPKKCLIIK